MLQLLALVTLLAAPAPSPPGPSEPDCRLGRDRHGTIDHSCGERWRAYWGTWLGTGHASKANYNIATTYEMEAAYPKAQEAYESVLADKDADERMRANAAFALGMLYERQGRYVDAANAFVALAKAEPTTRRAYDGWMNAAMIFALIEDADGVARGADALAADRDNPAAARAVELQAIHLLAAKGSRSSLAEAGRRARRLASQRGAQQDPSVLDAQLTVANARLARARTSRARRSAVKALEAVVAVVDRIPRADRSYEQGEVGARAALAVVLAEEPRAHRRPRRRTLTILEDYQFAHETHHGRIRGVLLRHVVSVAPQTLCAAAAWDEAWMSALDATWKPKARGKVRIAVAQERERVRTRAKVTRDLLKRPQHRALLMSAPRSCLARMGVMTTDPSAGPRIRPDERPPTPWVTRVRRGSTTIDFAPRR